MSAPTCASCQHFGHVYNSCGDTHDHVCGMSNQRRKEGMTRNADFLDHFRTFFDAQADSAICKHYADRPIADDAIIDLLRGMESSAVHGRGHGEFEFFSAENSLAYKLDGMFVKSDMHARPTGKPGNRVFWLLPAGKLELQRARAAGTAP